MCSVDRTPSVRFRAIAGATRSPMISPSARHVNRKKIPSAHHRPKSSLPTDLAVHAGSPVSKGSAPNTDHSLRRPHFCAQRVQINPSYDRQKSLRDGSSEYRRSPHAACEHGQRSPFHQTVFRTRAKWPAPHPLTSRFAAPCRP